MLEEVDDCGIYAPRILQKLVIDEDKNTEYNELPLKMKPAEENSVLPAPKVKENELEVDYSIIPIAQNNNSKDLIGIASPIVHKEVAEAENSVLLNEPSYELDKADSALASPIKNKEKEATEQSVQHPNLGSKEPEQGNTDSASPVLHRVELEDIESSVLPIVHRDAKGPTAPNVHKVNTREDVDSILSVLPKSSTNVYTPYNDSDYLEKLLFEENNEQRLGATAIHTAYDILHEDTEIFATGTEYKEAVGESSARATECASSSGPLGEKDGTDSSSSSESEDEDSSLTCTIVKMNGREYYSYFQLTKKKEHYTMYPHGKVVLPRGLVLHFRETTGMTREDIKGALQPLGAKIAFMDFEKGDKEGWVRLKDCSPAKDILQKMTDNTIKIKGVNVVFRELKGKEERKYLNRAGKGIAEMRKDKASLYKKLKKNGFKYVKMINN